jgi:hypothetical protein
MDNSYTPVEYSYREIIDEEIAKQTCGKIFHFLEDGTIESSEGTVRRSEEIPGKGLFIHLDNDDMIRIDRIITLFGKPGAAYDEYDAYANACLNCSGPHGAREDE